MKSPREQLTSEELAMALSNYDLGVIRSVKEFPRGAHGAPKLVIESDRGSYLLKRRPKGKDDPAHVAFAHAIQNYLAEHSFPLPHLIDTKAGSDSLLRIRDGVYELFEYIPSAPYDGGVVAAYEAGRMLGLFHRLIGECPAVEPAPQASYHLAPNVLSAFKKIGEQLGTALEGQPRAELIETLRHLRDAYKTAATAAEEIGVSRWETQIIHGDWHPGNMLFDDKGHAIAVIDFDSARIGPRILDVANGVLQFSFIAGGRDLANWQERADELRARRFLRGYDGMIVLSEAELLAVPHLAQESLIAQSVGPVLRTGTFAGLDGPGYLEIIRRKARWLAENAAALNLPTEE